MTRGFHSAKLNAGALAALSCVVFVQALWPGPACAQSGIDSRELERLREEASRPFRWIIENGKLPARRPRTPEPAVEAVAPTAPSAAPASAAPTTATRSPSPRAVGETKGKARASSSRTAGAGAPASRSEREPRNAYLTKNERPTAALQAPSAAGDAMAAASEVLAAAKPSSEPSLPSRLPIDDSEEELVALHQPPPDVWPGFCLDRCDRYYFNVTFRVLTDGRVQQVRVAQSNYARLNSAVVKAVSQWRYKPITAARDEEVTIRMAPQ
jgi:TonB family protein